jgi:hypothetical protein
LEADSKVRFVFSSKGGLKVEEIKEYLSRLTTERERHDYRGVDNIDIENTLILTSGKAVGLQIADAVASSYFFAVEKNRLNRVEPSYMQQIRHLSYASQGGCVFRNGVKIFPKNAEQLAPHLGGVQNRIADPGP